MFTIIAFVVALLILVLVHEWGHFAAARWFKIAVEEFGFGFPPRAFAKKIGETVFSLNWLPLGGFVRIKGEEHEVEAADSYSAQPIWKRAVIVVAGVVMNLVLAVVLLWFGYGVGLSQEIDGPLDAHVVVSRIEHRVLAVLPNTPAAAVLQSGDQILSLDGQQFTDRLALQQYIRGRANQAITVVFVRDGQSLATLLTPTQLTTPSGETVAGVGVEISTVGVVSYPWYRALGESIKTTGRVFWMIGSTLGEAVASLWRGSSGGLDIAGPIGIAVISGEVARQGAMAYLQFLALLSINLAFVNLIPFPALDGGRLLFLGIEALRRRPVSPRLEGAITRIGVTVLVVLILTVTFADLRRFAGPFVGWWTSLW